MIIRKNKKIVNRLDFFLKIKKYPRQENQEVSIHSRFVCLSYIYNDGDLSQNVSWSILDLSVP